MHDRAQFAEVTLSGAKVGGQLMMTNSTFTGPLDITGAFFEGPLNMIGSIFEGPLNMNGLDVNQHLLMDRAQFTEVNLDYAKMGETLSMTGATFVGSLNMNSLKVNQSLFMQEKARFAAVNLSGAEVGGELSMTGSTFEGPLNMNSLKVKQHLLMKNGARFATVDLGGAKVGRQLEMNGSTFGDLLNMIGLEVSQSLLMHQVLQFTEVKLNRAKVGGHLSMDGSTYKRSLNMNYIHIGLDLLMRNVNVLGEGLPVNLVYAEILGNLNISGSHLPSLDLTGTNIQGELCLGLTQPVNWRPGARLILRNTKVGALQDHPDSWPERLDLKDFTYDRLGGWSQNGENPITNRNVSWFCDWLRKQPDYSPQPYQYLASILLKSGHRMKSDEILYAGRERERKSTHGLAWVWMTLLKEVIGYGYKIWLALVWAVLAVVVGMDVLVLNGILWPNQIGVKGIPEEFAYSLDILLPGVQLAKHHFDIVLDGWIKYYFYVHRLIGVILGFFLIAGVSGLTKK